MQKKFKYIILIMIFSLFLSGCSLLKRDNMEDISIITTIYSLEYVINYLYGDNAVINSIYPDDTNIDNYTFTDKQIRDNSKKDLFIYMGKTKDSDIAITYLNNNKNLKLIDASFGIEYKNGEEELWMNPSNLLMIAENIRNGLNEYISSSYLIKEIDNNYNNLKIELSELDADVKLSFENASKNTIFTNSNALKYLSKYGVNVIVLNKNDNQYEKNLTLLKNRINGKAIKYFYALENVEIPSEVQELVDNKSIKLETLHNLKNINDQERNNKINYIELSKDNLNMLKKELY